jgi:hypothetical protein
MHHQYAWLELDRGMWNLFTDKPKEPVRKWVKGEAALAELREGGWTIDGPYPKVPKKRFYGYGLTMIVH